MSGSVRTNSPMEGSSMNPLTPCPADSTIIVALPYRAYPAATICLQYFTTFPQNDYYFTNCFPKCLTTFHISMLFPTLPTFFHNLSTDCPSFWFYFSIIFLQTFHTFSLFELSAIFQTLLHSLSIVFYYVLQFLCLLCGGRPFAGKCFC